MHTRLSLALLATLALSGCGTFHNLNDGGRIYGGVQTDLAVAGLLTAGALQDDQEAWARAYCLTLGAATLAVDMPLSAAADTLTLPLTCLVTYHRLTAPPPASNALSPGTPAGEHEDRSAGAPPAGK